MQIRLYSALAISPEVILTAEPAAAQSLKKEVEGEFKRSTAKFGSEEEVRNQIVKAGDTVEKVKAEIRRMLQQQHWVESQVEAGKPVTDSEAEKFYKDNPEQFQVSERVRASHILFLVKADATPAEVISKEKAARDVSARLKQGEDFQKVPQEVSEDPTASQNGGDLDFFTREQMVPEFSAVAFSMKKDEISDPVRSQFGYHVIKITDRKPRESMPLAAAKPQLVAYLTQQRKQGRASKSHSAHPGKGRRKSESAIDASFRVQLRRKARSI